MNDEKYEVKISETPRDFFDGTVIEPALQAKDREVTAKKWRDRIPAKEIEAVFDKGWLFLVATGKLLKKIPVRKLWGE